jgi:hypothetical protein
MVELAVQVSDTAIAIPKMNFTHLDRYSDGANNEYGVGGGLIQMLDIKEHGSGAGMGLSRRR